MPALDFFLHELEEKAERYGINFKLWGKGVPKKALKEMDIDLPDAVHIRECIANGWSKLEQYYILDSSAIYSAAVVLNPVHKWQYFDTHWVFRVQGTHLGLVLVDLYIEMSV